MKICVVGAGGVGGLLAAVLRKSGADVSLLATERHVAAIRKNGLAVIAPDGRYSVEIRAERDPGAIGACDVVLVTPKMWAVEALAPTLKPLLGRNTAVIPAQNGIDAPGVLARALGWEHVVYGSASLNAAIEEPGVIRQRNPQHAITVAEAPGRNSDRLLKVKEAFGAAGILVNVTSDGPALLWEKFIGLVSNSSLCALLRSPMGVVQKDEDTWALYCAVFNEVVAVGARIGHLAASGESRRAARGSADVAADGDAFHGGRSDRGQSPGVSVARRAGPGAGKGARRSHAGERLRLRGAQAIRGRENGLENPGQTTFSHFTNRKWWSYISKRA